MPFAAAGTARSLLKAVKTPSPTWELISLNRFWSVYDTLKDGTFSATLSLTYDPAVDFPSAAGFSEDALVIAGLNHLSDELEPLPSVLDKGTHTVTTPYTKVFDTWVIASCRTTTDGVGQPSSPVPTRFVLEQNYPNPFNPSTTIKYELTKSSHITLRVYDILGRLVSELVNERKNAGVHEVKFAASGLSSGVYFYRLQARPLDFAIGGDSRAGAGSFVQTRMLLLLR
jgi:hypothetical protein